MPPPGTRRTILDTLKRAPDATVAQIAEPLGVTRNAVRLHLEALEDEGLVARRTLAPTGPGRPPIGWSLTPAAHRLFPDSHSELAVALLDGIRDALGDDALTTVVAARVAAQEANYRTEVPPRGSLRRRVEALARRRSAEGYVAEVVDDPTDPRALVLVEHHCPIADAAHSCVGLCSGELELFRRVLGESVSVERTQHLLAGDARCAYRISLPSGGP